MRRVKEREDQDRVAAQRDRGDAEQRAVAHLASRRLVKMPPESRRYRKPGAYRSSLRRADTVAERAHGDSDPAHRSVWSTSHRARPLSAELALRADRRFNTVRSIE